MQSANLEILLHRDLFNLQFMRPNLFLSSASILSHSRAQLCCLRRIECILSDQMQPPPFPSSPGILRPASILVQLRFNSRCLLFNFISRRSAATLLLLPFCRLHRGLPCRRRASRSPISIALLLLETISICLRRLASGCWFRRQRC